FLGWERQSVYSRLIRLLTQQGAGRRAWKICEQSRGRTWLEQLAKSRLPAPAGGEQTWWQQLQFSLNQIRTLSSEAATNEKLVVLPNKQAWQLLTETQNELKIMLADAPKSARPWLDLVRGYLVSYGDLQNFLSV
ncbi:MAG: hypothetical protein KC415_04040, partial [Anaerolineales bacterium]|nr:hypothetical protein [Anaerolineales bacterium]